VRIRALKAGTGAPARSQSATFASLRPQPETSAGRTGVRIARLTIAEVRRGGQVSESRRRRQHCGVTVLHVHGGPRFAEPNLSGSSQVRNGISEPERDEELIFAGYAIAEHPAGPAGRAGRPRQETSARLPAQVQGMRRARGGAADARAATPRRSRREDTRSALAGRTDPVSSIFPLLCRPRRQSPGPPAARRPLRCPHVAR
jgi:hypothetical protein